MLSVTQGPLTIRDRLNDVVFGALMGTLSTALIDLLRFVVTHLRGKFVNVPSSLDRRFIRTITAASSAAYLSETYDTATQNILLIKILRMYSASLNTGAQAHAGALALCFAADRASHPDQFGRYKSQGTKEARIINEPSLGVWTAVPGYDGLDICYEQTVKGDEKQKSSDAAVKQIFSVRANDVKVCFRFVMDALDYYRRETKEQTESPRMFYIPKYGFSGKRTWSEFPLSNNKTFKTVFFPKKARLIAQLDEFRDGTGKYAIPGVKRQLGLLLHGPPGTGKTSIIKAMAEYLGRHIICIHLNAVQTNGELFELMLHPNVMHDDGQHKSYSFKDVIFLLEDVDAASGVVLQRKEPRPHVETEDVVDVSSAEKETGTVDAAAELRMATAAMLTTTKTMLQKKNKGNGERLPQGQIEAFMVACGDKDVKGDELTLSGVLNALDGVVDADHRMFVMTTNYEAVLDKALTRKGRISIEVKMGYLIEETTREMARHFFANITREQEDRLVEIVTRRGNVSPADFECEAVGAESPNDMFVV